MRVLNQSAPRLGHQGRYAGFYVKQSVRKTGLMKSQGTHATSTFLVSPRYTNEEDALPTLQTESLTAQREFCEKIRGVHEELLSNISVSWSNKHTENMWDLSMLEDLTAAFGNESRAVLQKIDGVVGATGSQGTFSIYIFDDQNGQSDVVSSSLKNDKTWERHEIDRLILQLKLFAERKNLKRSETYFIDIGSNLGYFSLSAASEGFQVIAIEAMSINQYATRMSICANKDFDRVITLVPVALSYKNEHCDLFSDGHNVLDGTIRCGSPEELAALEDDNRNHYKRQDVEMTRLDDVLNDWMPSLAGRVGAMKIDTEGLEPYIIQGGPIFFSKVKPAYIQMEVSSSSVHATGVDAVKLLNWMELFGYTVHESADGPPVEPKDITIHDPGPGNAFMYAKDP